MGLQWIILITVIVIFVQSSLYRRWGLSRVTYSRTFSANAVFAGDQVELIERIANPKLLPLPWLRLESLIPAPLQFLQQANLDMSVGQYFQNHKSLFSLLPYMQITRRHQVTCLKRGYYKLDSVAMTSGDLIGLQPTTKQLKLDARLFVYPKLLPYEQIPLPSHSWQGDLIVKRWIVEDPFMISGVRDYHDGDSLNRINWKATARTQRLQVHQTDFTADHRLMIYVNFDISEEMWEAVSEPERIELGLSYAATLAQYALSQGIATGFGCNAFHLETPQEPVRMIPEGGAGQLEALLECMARLEMARNCNFTTFLEQDVVQGMSNTDYYLFTCYQSEKINELIAALQALGNAVVMIMLEPPEEEGEQNEATNP